MGRSVDKTPELTAGLEAERAVLGAMLIDEDCVCEVLAEVDDSDFSSNVNRLIFQAARSVLREGGHVDAITVRGKLGSALGAEADPYLIGLMEITPTSASWREYAQIMREQAALGRIRDISSRLRDASTLDDCRPLLAELQNQLAARRGMATTAMPDLLSDFAARQAEDRADSGYIGYGIDVIDNRSYIRRGHFVILGGYPSDGKTALALMIAYHMAKTLKVGFYSLETDPATIGDRLVTQSMGIDFDRIKQRRLTDRDWGSFAVASDDAAVRKLDIINASGSTVSDISAHALAHGYDVIFVDYAQLIVPEGNPRDIRSEQMAGVSRALHTFAQSRSVLVVALAQLSRPERGAWHAPDMHDLKESGQFEQDADQILLIYRPSPNSPYSREKFRILQIAKNKEGRCGSGVFAFDGNHQTFAPYKREEKKPQGCEAPGQVAFSELPSDTPAPF